MKWMFHKYKLLFGVEVYKNQQKNIVPKGVAIGCSLRAFCYVSFFHKRIFLYRQNINKYYSNEF